MTVFTAFLAIGPILLSIVAAICGIVYFSMLYSYVPGSVTPQFESIIGSVLIGSVILSVLAYLALIQHVDPRNGAILSLTFLSIIAASTSFGLSAQ